jgi:threonine dehydratase
VLPTAADVQCAARTLDGVAHRTPVLTSATLDRWTGAQVHMKAEHLQRVGAFKFRGALHALTHLPAGTPVVAYSSGNHAQAVALAAALHGVSSTIVMPSDAPAVKRAATEGYGATVVSYDRATEDREAIAARIADSSGARLIAPFDDRDVIAGQGTAAAELLEQVGCLDVLVVPLGGGGLLAGSLLAMPDTVRVYGVEPAAGDDWARSLAAGERTAISPPVTVADSLAATLPGVLTWPIVSARVAGVITVTEEQLIVAVRFGLDRLHQVLEPGGAAALAAVLAGLVPLVEGRRVGIVLSGGNVGAGRLAELLRR